MLRILSIPPPPETKRTVYSGLFPTGTGALTTAALLVSVGLEVINDCPVGAEELSCYSECNSDIVSVSSSDIALFKPVIRQPVP